MNIKTLFTKVALILTISQGALAADHSVEIKNFKFNPAEITAEKGDTVTFINLDSAPHSVVPDKDSLVSFDPSSIMQTNDDFILEITESKDVLAKCGVHPMMPGLSIRVVSPAQKLIQEIKDKMDELEMVIDNE